MLCFIGIMVGLCIVTVGLAKLIDISNRNKDWFKALKEGSDAE